MKRCLKAVAGFGISIVYNQSSGETLTTEGLGFRKFYERSMYENYTLQ